MNRPPISRAAAAALTFALVAAACGGDDDEAAETTTTEATTTTTEATTTTTTSTTTSTTTTTSSTTTTEPAPEEPLRQPLTGVPVESEDELITRPALAVKIDNHPSARRNHSGLVAADIVFEEIVEGQLTRFAAVLHTQDADPIGPIRSGRTQDVNLLSSMNEPLFAWSGGNPGVTRAIADSFLTDLNWQRNAGSYSRGSGPTPHNLYSSSERLYALTPEDHPGAPPQQFQYVFPDDEFAGEREVTSVDLDMRSIDVQWDWNADDGVWERSQEGGPHVEADGDRIVAENVIVMVVAYRPSVVDARSPEAQTLGEGIAYVFSDGQVIEATWSRELAVGTIKFLDADGEPVRMTPGTTWVELAELIESPDAPVPPVAMTILPETSDDESDGGDESDDEESDG